jgi:hypothetical protein
MLGALLGTAVNMMLHPQAKHDPQFFAVYFRHRSYQEDPAFSGSGCAAGSRLTDQLNRMRYYAWRPSVPYQWQWIVGSGQAGSELKQDLKRSRQFFVEGRCVQPIRRAMARRIGSNWRIKRAEFEARFIDRGATTIERNDEHVNQFG